MKMKYSLNAILYKNGLNNVSAPSWLDNIDIIGMLNIDNLLIAENSLLSIPIALFKILNILQDNPELFIRGNIFIVLFGELINVYYTFIGPAHNLFDGFIDFIKEFAKKLVLFAENSDRSQRSGGDIPRSSGGNREGPGTSQPRGSASPTEPQNTHSSSNNPNEDSNKKNNINKDSDTNNKNNEGNTNTSNVIYESDVFYSDSDSNRDTEANTINNSDYGSDISDAETLVNDSPVNGINQIEPRTPETNPRNMPSREELLMAPRREQRVYRDLMFYGEQINNNNRLGLTIEEPVVNSRELLNRAIPLSSINEAGSPLRRHVDLHRTGRLIDYYEMSNEQTVSLVNRPIQQVPTPEVHDIIIDAESNQPVEDKPIKK